eukprot:CAMPEP_0181323414 /NCGR_PEP_ID=MMETSP1101-20121128/19773_1 /TAXON_ID=46948 /ORGANISM="Rhodomonas abbreviata, Strain Caron Lab Isolate" /LENGTH=91 /DNA_ID=CAMNT_0023431441 /DNA_START=102 /DNA_END=377 /DNA_ORIENTATION=-
MTTEGLKGYKEKERAAETVWFNKEEERLIHKLMEKLQKQKLDAEAKSCPHEAEMEDISKKYNMSPEDKETLLRAANGMSVAGLVKHKYTSP